ncbi:MAG: hypothetical protein HYU60_03680 [Magnetospirillum sp.]|nr:hypothetical protein [Magnetospirillum sp.]
MDELTGAPSHVLLNRKDQAGDHSTRKLRKGAGGAAFQSFGYGPLDLPNHQNKASGTDDNSKKAATGNGLNTSMLGTNIGWLTHLSMAEHKK